MAGRVGNRKMSKDHPNYNTVEVCHNTEKSPGHLRRLTVIQIPEGDYQLIWVLKTPKGVIIIIIMLGER